MSWIVIAILAYFLMALSQLIDKALLNAVFKEAKSYVFLIGVLGGLVFVLLPFGIDIPSTLILILALFGGALFILALLPFLSALRSDEATRVIPLIGATIPLVVFFGENLFFGNQLTLQNHLAFILLVIGAVILTFIRKKTSRRSWSAMFKAFLSAFLFGCSFIITKAIYNELTFINGFFWMRIGGVIVALLLLINNEVRHGLKQFFSQNKWPVKFGYLGNQALNGAGFILQSYAVSLASVSLVSAMQGVQYIFIIGLVMIVSRLKPNLLRENITFSVLVEKLTAVIIIMAGLVLLFL